MLIYVLFQHLLITLGDRCAFLFAPAAKDLSSLNLINIVGHQKRLKSMVTCVCASPVSSMAFIELQSVCCISFPFIKLLF